MKLKQLFAAALLLCSVGAWAQTNLVAGWDGGDDTSSPSNFGWTSSTNRTLNARNASGGVRMTTTYSGYKLEDGTSYSYSATSDPSSVIFWIRYGSSGESYTYTFQGLEADSYYDFSCLLAWHNNSNAPTFTVKINDGTSDLATVSKYISDKQKLYAVSTRFKTPSTTTSTTDIKIVFTCNQTGDCMEAVSALSLVNVIAKDELQAALSYANRVNTTLNNSTLASSITTAQGVYDNASATQAEVNSAASTLSTAVVTALGDAAPADMSFVIDNAGFESSTAISANQSTGSSQDYTSSGWTALSTSTGNSCGAVVAYGSSFTLNNVTAPSADNNSASGNALGISIGWNVTVAYQSSAVTLPAGSYTMTVYGYNNNTSGSNFTSKNGFVTSSNNYLSTKTSFTNGTWETDVITFSLTEPTTGVFQIGGTAGNNTSTSHAKVFFDNITLAYSNPLKAAQDALQAEIDKASLCDAKEGLADAIAAAQGVLTSATTEAELEAALATLQAADKDAVLRYENGLADATASAPVVTDFVVNGTFDSNVNGWTATGGFQNNQTANNQYGDFTGNFYENWNGSAKPNKMYQTINNIPNGTYRLDICAFVNNYDVEGGQFVFANVDKQVLTRPAPTAYEIYTVVTTNQIEIGLEQTSSVANWMGIDNVSLRYYGAGDVVTAAQNAAHTQAWLEAKAAAEAAIANSAYDNVTGSERTALTTEIGKAEPTTADGYDAAAEALNSATAAFTAAAPAYDALATEIAYALTLGFVDTDDAEAAQNSATATAASVTAATQALKVLEYTTIHDDSYYPHDVTALLGTWTAGNYATASGQGYIADETYFDKWNASPTDLTSSKTITLPAGAYVVQVAGRGVSTTTMNLSVKVGDADAVSTPFLMTGDTGKGIDTAGATNFSDEGTYSNDNVGRGWQYRYIIFDTDGQKEVTISINGHLGASTWQSFYAPVLLCDDVTLADIYAGAAEYTALNNAIAAAEAKTLGFADGEYAPYANVAALEALAAAKAIDQTAQNMKAVVEAATTALTGATWTPNDGDVEIIYNGMFATAAEGQNYPEGWTRTNGWGQMRTIDGDEEQFATAYYNQPGSLQYGNQGVYTMPLKANTPYNLHFYYRSHENNSNKGVTVSVLNENNEGMAPATFMENGNTQEWAEASASFTTGAAGNYVLTLANLGNTWMTCINLTNLHSIDPTFTATEDFNEVDGPTTGHDRMYIETVNITRKVKDGFNTVCLPFDVTAEGVTRAFGANAKVYTYSETSTDPDDVTINFNLKDGNTISANVPVLIGDATTSEAQTFSAVMFKSYTGDYPVVAGTNFDFAGVYAPMTVAEGDYFIGGGKLYKSVAGTTTTINAFRAYIDNKSNNSGVEVKMYIDGITTDINAIDNEQMSMDNEAIYTIAGQRVQKAQKGLYIVNGKKVAVR